MLRIRLKAAVMAVVIAVSAVGCASGEERGEIQENDLPLPRATTSTRDESKDIVLLPEDSVERKEAVLENEYAGMEGASLLLREGSEATWKFSAEAGSYTIRVVYCAMDEGSTSILRTIKVNGQAENETTGITFPRRWEDIRDDEGKFLEDAYGNQLVPQQTETFSKTDIFLTARGGYSDTPLAVNLQDGENTLTISGDSRHANR